MNDCRLGSWGGGPGIAFKESTVAIGKFAGRVDGKISRIVTLHRCKMIFLETGKRVARNVG